MRSCKYVCARSAVLKYRGWGYVHGLVLLNLVDVQLLGNLDCERRRPGWVDTADVAEVGLAMEEWRSHGDQIVSRWLFGRGPPF